MKQLFTHKNKLPIIIFYLFLFFLPQQFGPHFWPLFSYVKGIRTDYLSPTIYISDVLLLLLFILSFKSVFKNKQTYALVTSKRFLLFLIVLCVPFLYASSPANLFYGLFLFFKYLYVGLFAAVQIKRRHINKIAIIIFLGGILQSFLAFFQFLSQSSIGYVLYFFGERTMFLSSIGAAVVNTSYGLLLRPYGTFPHPNVLACYLLVSFIFGLHIYKLQKQAIYKLLTLSGLIIIQIGILISFSRTILIAELFFLTTIGLPYGNVKNFRNHIFIHILIGILIVSFLIFFSNRYSNMFHFSSAITPRVDLLKINTLMIKEFPAFGTGLQNYLYKQVEFQKNFSSIYLQPVHNIYMLITVQTGILGLGIVLWFLYQTFQKIKRQVQGGSSLSPFLFACFLCLLFIGFFDHYLITISQGQLIIALILGLCWNQTIFKK